MTFKLNQWRQMNHMIKINTQRELLPTSILSTFIANFSNRHKIIAKNEDFRTELSSENYTFPLYIKSLKNIAGPCRLARL